jgi:hypothetical protein
MCSGYVYMGIGARGRDFAKLWLLETAIENNVNLKIKITSCLIPFQNHLRRKNMQSKKFLSLYFSSYSILKFKFRHAGKSRVFVEIQKTAVF